MKDKNKAYKEEIYGEITKKSLSDFKKLNLKEVDKDILKFLQVLIGQKFTKKSLTDILKNNHKDICYAYKKNLPEKLKNKEFSKEVIEIITDNLEIQDKHDFILKDSLYCLECGKKMTSDYTTLHEPRYRCKTYTQNRGCTKKYISAKKLEEKVKAILMKVSEIQLEKTGQNLINPPLPKKFKFEDKRYLFFKKIHSKIIKEIILEDSKKTKDNEYIEELRVIGRQTLGKMEYYGVKEGLSEKGFSKAFFSQGLLEDKKYYINCKIDQIFFNLEKKHGIVILKPYLDDIIGEGKITFNL